MRRVLSGFVPLAMAGAALFGAAPAATAAPSHPAAAACQNPPYGPGHCVNISVTITYNPNGTITIHVVATGFKPGEQVNITITVPSRNAGSFTADANGAIAADILLPGGYAKGDHALTALGTSSGAVGSTSFTLSRGSGTIRPCTASISSAHTEGVVLAAAYLSAQCKSALPAVAGGPPSSGGNGNAAISNGVAAVGTASSASNASQLPFTGFNAATVAASGAILVGAGGALVLVSRRRRRTAWQ